MELATAIAGTVALSYGKTAAAWGCGQASLHNITANSYIFQIHENDNV